MTTFKMLTLFLSLAAPAFAQNTPTLSVMGEVASPLTLSPQDLASFKTRIHQAKDHDNTMHEFRGVALIDLLEKAGVTMGSRLRGKNLTRYLLIGAADGYEVLFSLPEVDPEFTDQVVLVVTEKDGKPLPAGEGPFRIIVPQDKKQARWVRQARTIRVQ